MPLSDAVRVIRETRRDDDVVIPSMGNAREWMAQGPLHPLDFVLVPSAMGHATSMGYGMALAQPSRRVIVLSGDGSLLMNLGSLVTIATTAPKNLSIVVFVNGVYEVTGGQRMPGTPSMDFTGIARGCGLDSVHRVSALEDWQRHAGKLLYLPHANVLFLDVDKVVGAKGPRSPGKAGERARAFRLALGAAG